MYIEIKDGKLVSWCKNPYQNYEYVDIDYDSFDLEKYSVVDGVLTDISQTDEYKNIQEEKNKKVVLANLKEKIDDLDKKRIRAFVEPAVKDSETGQTWLEYYTNEIVILREQLSKTS